MLFDLGEPASDDEAEPGADEPASDDEAESGAEEEPASDDESEPGAEELLDELYRELETRQILSANRKQRAQYPNALPATIRPIKASSVRSASSRAQVGAPAFLFVSSNRQTPVRPTVIPLGTGTASPLGGRLRLARPASSAQLGQDPSQSPRRVGGGLSATHSRSLLSPNEHLVSHAGRVSQSLPTSALLYGKPELVHTQHASTVPPVPPREHPIVAQLLKRQASSPQGQRAAAAQRASAHRAATVHPRGLPAAPERSGRSWRAPRFDPVSNGAFRASRGPASTTALTGPAADAQSGLLRSFGFGQSEGDEFVAAARAAGILLADLGIVAGGRHQSPPGAKPPRAGGQFVRSSEKRQQRRQEHEQQADGIFAPEPSSLQDGRGLDAPPSSPSLGVHGMAFSCRGSSSGPDPSLAQTESAIEPLPFMSTVSNIRFLWEQRHALSRSLKRQERLSLPRTDAQSLSHADAEVKMATHAWPEHKLRASAPSLLPQHSLSSTWPQPAPASKVAAVRQGLPGVVGKPSPGMDKRLLRR